MKNRLLVFCIFLNFFCLVSISAQNPLNGYLRNFQYQKALDYIDTQEQTKELLIQKGFCYKSLGDYQKALEILYPLSKEYVNDFQIITEMAFCYEALSQRELSIDCYNKLISLDSANVYFRMQKADLLYQQEKYRQSLDLFQYINIHHEMPNASKRIAQCFEKLNMADSAMVYYKAAWDRNFNDGFSASSLVNLCLKNKRALEALGYSDLYLEKDTTNRQMNLLNALSYYSVDDYEGAIVRFKKCYDRGDGSLVVLRSLGISYYSMNDSYNAQPLLEEAFRQDTTNNNVLYCLAIACNDMGEHKKAIPYFIKLLERTIPPDLTLYLYYRNLGSAYDKGSHFREAADTYVKALTYGGENQKMNLYYMIGNLFESSLDDKDKAITYFKLYKTSLSDYLNSLKVKENVDPNEVEEIESKARYLDLHILKLEKETGS